MRQFLPVVFRRIDVCGRYGRDPNVSQYCNSNARQNNRFVVKGVQESEHQVQMIQMHVTTRRLLR